MLLTRPANNSTLLVVLDKFLFLHINKKRRAPDKPEGLKNPRTNHIAQWLVVLLDKRLVRGSIPTESKEIGAGLHHIALLPGTSTW